MFYEKYVFSGTRVFVNVPFLLIKAILQYKECSA